MADYNRGRSSGGRSFGPKRDFKKRSFMGDAGDRQMHAATCASCGKACQVPFEPTGSRPVYCRECFQKNDDRPPVRQFDTRPPRSFPPKESGDNGQTKKQLDAMNVKLDKILALLDPLTVTEE